MIEAFRVGAVSRLGTLWDGLDLAFGDGEAWFVAGPPSCGKTTLMRVLAGERRPDAGDVVAGGESLYRGNARAKAVFRAATALVPERFPDGPGKSVSDLFRLSALSSGLSDAERKRREEELLPMVGMGGAGRWDLSALSLSERARVALAADLSRVPRYLFADMLFENVGAEWGDMLLALFRALAREGKTVVVSGRKVPARIAAQASLAGLAAGPFRLFRLAPEPGAVASAGRPV